MVLTRSNKVYYNDADDVENKRNSANVAKVVSTIEKAAFVPPPERNLRNMILGEIWKEIKKKKGDETEGSSYGIITSILNKNKAQFPWLTRNMINYFKKKNLLPEVINLPSQRSDVSPTSDLTDVITTDRDDAVQALLNISSNRPVKASSLEGENHEDVAANEQPAKNKGGRPKGSTNEAKSDAVKRKKLAMNDAALRMKRLKEDAAVAGKRVP